MLITMLRQFPLSHRGPRHWGNFNAVGITETKQRGQTAVQALRRCPHERIPSERLNVSPQIRVIWSPVQQVFCWRVSKRRHASTSVFLSTNPTSKLQCLFSYLTSFQRIITFIIASVNDILATEGCNQWRVNVRETLRRNLSEILHFVLQGDSLLIGGELRRINHCEDDNWQEWKSIQHWLTEG